MAHFQKHWSADLQEGMRECIQKAVCGSCHYLSKPHTYENQFEACYHISKMSNPLKQLDVP